MEIIGCIGWIGCWVSCWGRDMFEYISEGLFEIGCVGCWKIMGLVYVVCGVKVVCLIGFVGLVDCWIGCCVSDVFE